MNLNYHFIAIFRPIIKDEMNRNHTETMINSFTLSQLIEMSGDNRQGLMRECFTASSDNRMEIFRFPCRIDAFVIGVGTEGETSVSLNLHEYRLKKNSIFIFSPKNILQVKSEEYFKADVIVVSPDFLRRINIDTKNLLQLFLQFAANPCLTLTHEESHSIRSFIAQIERETRGKETHFTYDIINGLIAATIYKVGDVLYNYLSEHPEVQNPIHNRAEEYFKQFTHLLGEHYRTERSVGFYARQLCITPKYLTTLTDQRAVGFGVDRQLRDHRGQDTAQIFHHEHSGDRLLPQFPEPIVLRQLLQTQYGHVAFAVQGTELTARHCRRQRSLPGHTAGEALCVGLRG